MYIGLICMQLIPTAVLMAFYSSGGAVSITIGFFQSLSIGFIKLPMMIFPYIYGSIMQPLNMHGVSEMDIEIFFGILLTFFLFVGVLKYRKDFRVRLCFVFMALAFIYAMNAHIPYLSEIIFRVPVLNGFRVPSRILFIFMFFGYVMFAHTLSKLIDSGEGKDIWEYAAAYMLFIFSIIAVSLFIYTANSPYSFNEVRNIFPSIGDYFSTAFLQGLSIVLVLLAVCYFGQKLYKKLPAKYHRYTGFVICMLIMIVTLTEVLPFTRLTHPCPGTVFDKNHVSVMIAEDIGDGKVFDALSTVGSEGGSPILPNLGVYKRIPTINAYTSFNNPYLYRHFYNGRLIPLNSSSALKWFHNLGFNLNHQNDMLSMLNVKYIIDNSSIINADGSTFTAFDKESSESIFKVDRVIIEAHELFVYSTSIELKQNAFYGMEFTAEAQIAPEMLYIDFYGGKDFDHPEHNLYFSIKEGTDSYFGVIFTGRHEIPEATNLRIIATTSLPIVISNLVCYEYIPRVREHVYIPYFFDETQRVWENINAKGIIYAPDYVMPLNSLDDMYAGDIPYNLIEASYIYGWDGHALDISNVTTEINVEYFTNNSIKAIINASDDTFVNFSQNYYPEWRAYINGSEVPIYKVNNLIPGVFVPGGESVLEFRFVPTSLYIGGGITILTIAIIALVLYNHSRKVKLIKQEEEDGE
jgi:hypothetical protein